MKKLNKEQRNTFYIILLREIEGRLSQGRYVCGLCYLVSTHLLYGEADMYIYNWKKFERQLPELFAMRPWGIGEDDPWFSSTRTGWIKRKRLIERCIRETV